MQLISPIFNNVFSLKNALQQRSIKTCARLAALLLCFLFGHVAHATNAREQSLYERIGGQPQLEKIVDALIDKSSQDPASKRTFRKVDLKRLKGLITEQLCELTGGPVKYTGDTMKQSHAGLDITEAEFYRMVEHLREVLDAQDINTREKNELIALLAPMKRDVVTK
jgi:hemoglobin